MPTGEYFVHSLHSSLKAVEELADLPGGPDELGREREALIDIQRRLFRLMLRLSQRLAA